MIDYKKQLKTNKILFVILILFGIHFSNAQEIPIKFIYHKVKKRETTFGIIRKYNINEEQLNEYNSILKKVGLRKRMVLRIPVYPKDVEEKVKKFPKVDKSTQPYIVKPKETKWRIAYNFQITIPELEALNPKIKKGLKEGQEIRVPMLVRQRISETISDTMNQTVSQSVEPVWDSNYNYYKVLPKEGYFRIEKKIGVTKMVLDSLNPNLLELGIQDGMILRVPGDVKGELKIQDGLLVERLSLLDSIKETRKILTALRDDLFVNERAIEYNNLFFIDNTRDILILNSRSVNKAKDSYLVRVRSTDLGGLYTERDIEIKIFGIPNSCLLYTSPSPRDS